eukprot:s849_g32.t1
MFFILHGSCVFQWACEKRLVMMSTTVGPKMASSSLDHLRKPYPYCNQTTGLDDLPLLLPLDVERIIGNLVAARLARRKQRGLRSVPHFEQHPHSLRHIALSPMPSILDCYLGYVLGHVAGCLIEQEKSGYVANVRNIGEDVLECSSQIRGTPWENYPMAYSSKRNGKSYFGALSFRTKMTATFPVLAYGALRYFKTGYMKKFYTDDYPRASLSILSTFLIISARRAGERPARRQVPGAPAGARRAGAPGAPTPICFQNVGSKKE